MEDKKDEHKQQGELYMWDSIDQVGLPAPLLRAMSTSEAYQRTLRIFLSYSHLHLYFLFLLEFF